MWKLFWETWNNLASYFSQDRGQRINISLEIKKPNFDQETNKLSIILEAKGCTVSGDSW